jgi:hypothetical protein
LLNEIGNSQDAVSSVRLIVERNQLVIGPEVLVWRASLAKQLIDRHFLERRGAANYGDTCNNP